MVQLLFVFDFNMHGMYGEIFIKLGCQLAGDWRGIGGGLAGD